jgi:flavin-binding protein dodecin
MEPTYKKIEIVGISETSFGEATQNAVAKACQSLRHVDWFEVTEMRGLVANDKVKEFQVTVKIGFRLEEQQKRISRPGATNRPFGRRSRRFRRACSAIYRRQDRNR